MSDEIKKLYAIFLKYDLLDSISYVRIYFDEPRIHQYIASIKKFDEIPSNFVSSSGVSYRSRRLSLLKCLAEAAERISLFSYKNEGIIFTGKNPIQPHLNSTFYTNGSIKKNGFGWLKGANFINGKGILIPAQLIYLNYLYHHKEFQLTESISTGAAGGFDFESTLVRSIYEVIERDAFMTAYLLKVTPPLIDLMTLNSNTVKKLASYYKRYHLITKIFNITNDIGIPSFLSILLDYSSIGPAISIGIKSGLNIEQTIIGSLEEAFLSRQWIRKEKQEFEKSESKIDRHSLNKPINRGLFWYPVNMIKHLNFLLNQQPKSLYLEEFSLNKKVELQQLRNVLIQKNIEVFYKDITPSIFRRAGFLVYKVIMPQLQPLYLNENKPIIVRNRMKAVANFFQIKKVRVNPVPHPFL